jgi:plasmid stabilization system protein ParE
MGSTKIKIIWKPEAIVSLQNIYNYIWERSPQNAGLFVDNLIGFGDTLGDYPFKYAECRHRKFKAKNYRCAVFRKNWIFLYKVVHFELYIHTIIHARTIA